MTGTSRKKIYFGIFWTILVLSFLFFATLIVLLANGYHFNIKSFDLQKTGMVVIDSRLDDAEILLNGKGKIRPFPVKLSKIFPGKYDLEINKDGYYTWKKTYDIVGGQAVVIEDLVLFKKSPKVKDLSSTEKLLNRIKKNLEEKDTRMEVKENEIWYEEKLVTRFSQPVSRAVYDGVMKRFFAQIDKEIHVIDPDGSNDTVLIKLENNTPSNFIIDGRFLIYLQNDKVFQAEIR